MRSVSMTIEGGDLMGGPGMMMAGGDPILGMLLSDLMGGGMMMGGGMPPRMGSRGSTTLKPKALGDGSDESKDIRNAELDD